MFNLRIFIRCDEFEITIYDKGKLGPFDNGQILN